MPDLTDVPGIRVGHATDPDAATGCTVVIGPFRAACDVRGMATGTRELETLSPLHVAPLCDAILLTGGSAFGLAAADGVVAWLEEHGAGYQTALARVPIVPAAVIYDLGVGRADRRPDAAMGRAACEAATTGVVAEGRIGAGTGASVGKAGGPAAAMPGGLGTWSQRAGKYTVGGIVVVNAGGDILDANGRIVAGARGPDGAFLDSARLIRAGEGPRTFAEAATPGTNTTLAIVATDAPVGRVALNAIARMASTAFARRISPVNTPFDGDVTFAVSTAAESAATPAAEILRLGTVAAYVLEHAIERAATVE